MFTELKKKLAHLKAIVRELDVMDTREAESRKELDEASKAPSLDEPKTLARVTRASSWLSIITSRRKSFTEQLREARTDLLREYRSCASTWNELIARIRKETLNVRLEVKHQYHDGFAPRTANGVAQVRFPQLEELARTGWTIYRKPIDPKTDDYREKTEDEIIAEVKTFMEHVGNCADAAGITLPE